MRPRRIRPRVVEERLLPIIHDAAIAGPVAEGKLIPVLLLDVASMPEVFELIRVHEFISPGDVGVRWGVEASNTDNVVLALDFERPVPARFALRLSIEQQGILVECMLTAGAAYLQVGTPGDRLAASIDAPRLLVELPDAGFRARWDRLFLDKMTTVMARRLRVSQKEGRRRG